MKVGNKDIEEQLFSIVRELLANQGVKGWSMDDLATQSGLSKRTLYKIIGTKEQLLTKIIEESLSRYTLKIKQLTSQYADFEHQLNQVSATIIQNFDEFVITSSNSILKEYPQIGLIIQKKREELRTSNIEFYARGQQLGYISKQFEPEFINRMIDAHVEYNVNECSNKEEFEKETTKALHIIIKGISE